MTTRWIVPLLVLFWFVSAPGWALADAVKIGTLAPKGSPWHDIVQDLSEAWKEASQGRHYFHTALQAGLIDAFQTTPIAALSFQWFGLAPHLTGLRWAPLVGAIVVSAKFWDGVPPALQARFLELSRAAGGRLQASLRTLESQALEVMREHGLSVHAVPPENLPIWEARARLGYPKIVGKVVPGDLVREVELYRDEYRRAQSQ